AIGAMGILQAESCIFIFWTPKGMLTLSIERDVYIRLNRSMPVRGLKERMVNSGIDDFERADSIVSLPDISRVCIKSKSVSNNDRVHRTINHRYDTDGIITREEMLISDDMDMFQEICEDLTNGF
ncbi:hypothetical protein PV325_011472, partial [Microctonus aethiopoides]